MTNNIINMTQTQLNDWLMPIVDCSLFASHERLATLLAESADREALETELREFYEGYCGLAFELEEPEGITTFNIAGI